MKRRRTKKTKNKRNKINPSNEHPSVKIQVLIHPNTSRLVDGNK